MVVHAVGTPSDSKCRIAAMGGVRLVSTKRQMLFFCSTFFIFVGGREQEPFALLPLLTRGVTMVRPSGPGFPSVKPVLLCACGTLSLVAHKLVL